jgi:lysophospholipase
MEITSTFGNPAPENAVCSKIVTSDGLNLRAISATVSGARGTVVVVGGRADFMERYFETMRDLMDRGFCVASLDFRGQGASDRLTRNRLRGHVLRFDDYEEDIRALMTQVVLPDCPPPYYALGHSTGGNVILRTIRRRNWFRKCVIVSPLIGLNYGAWPVPVARTISLAFSNIGLGWLFLPGMRRTPMGLRDFAGNPLSFDRERWQRDCAVLEAAPNLGIGAPTFRWLRAAINSNDLLLRLKGAKALRCPVLIVMAGRDTVVDNEATRKFASRVKGVSLTVIPEALHEILLERDEVREQFFAAFDAFIGESA